MGKPLSAEEIERLAALAARPVTRWLVDDGFSTDGLGETIPALLDEVRRSRALLKRIESGGCGCDNPQAAGCPSCGGGVVGLLAPSGSGAGTMRVEHKPGCELAALLGS